MARIAFYGRLQDSAGTRELVADLPADIKDAAALRIWLGRDNPRLGDSLADPAVLVAVNDVLAGGNPTVGPQDEIAFLPPMSGG